MAASSSAWVIVPVKPFWDAKSRLAQLLTGQERADLSRHFLEHTLSVLADVAAVAGTLVVSRDPAALRLALARGARGLAEDDGSELNSALEAATRAALVVGATSVLILPSDLPMLAPADVEYLLESAGDGTSMCIAPDRHGQGTNALLVQPPGLLTYHFGPGSFPRHVAIAERAGAAVHIIRRPGFALDVDVPDDWHLFQTARQA